MFLKQVATKKYWLIEALLIVTLLFIVGVMFKNIDLRAVPNPDVFQYIKDSRDYLQFKLPQNIHAPPGNPILIGLISKTFNHPEKEVLSAIGINIVVSMLAVYLAWRVSLQEYGHQTILLVLLLLTNAQIYSRGLDTTSEVLFTALVLLCILLYKKHRALSYLLAGFTFFVRYEAAGLVIAMLAAEIKNLWPGVEKGVKQSKSFIKYCLLGAVPILTWLLVINVQNNIGSLSGNEFIQEIIKGWGRLPTVEIITLFPHLLFESIKEENSYATVLFYVYIVCGILFFMKQNSARLNIYVSFAVNYLIFHLIFPAYEDRYLFPIIPLAYALCLWPLLFTKTKFGLVIRFIVVMSVLIIAKQNGDAINHYLRFYSTYSRLENRIVAEWLNHQPFKEKVTVVTLEPWITEYYTHNPHVKFFWFNTEQIKVCKSMSCYIGTIPAFYPNKILIVRDIYTDETFSVTAQEFRVDLFREFYKTDELTNLQPVVRLERANKWAMIYQHIR